MSKASVKVATGVVTGLISLCVYALLPSFFVCALAAGMAYALLVEWPRVNAHAVWWSYWYPAVPMVLLILHVLKWYDSAPWYGLYPFVAASIVDVAGYVVGTRWGRHKCWPTISPNKTWEGVFAGIGGLFGAHFFLLVAGVTSYSWWLLLFSAPLVAGAAIVGDCFVSWHKRQRGVKDTGELLPGHGGLLDRFDSALGIILVLKALEVVALIFLS